MLKKNGRQVYCSDALPITAPSPDKIYRTQKTEDAGSEAMVETEIAYTKVCPKVLSQCVAACIYVSGDAQSAVYTDQSEISLSAPAQPGGDERVKPEGFYRICEIILRMGAYKKSDMAVSQCRYQPENRSADIMPGLFLRSKTAVQMPQYKKNSVSSSGLVWANSSEIQAFFLYNHQFSLMLY